LTQTRCERIKVFVVKSVYHHPSCATSAMILGGARHACGKSNDSLLHVAQLPHGTVRIKPQNAVNDMIGSGLIRWVQVARL
jgi:hypothetical protein